MSLISNLTDRFLVTPVAKRLNTMLVKADNPLPDRMQQWAVPLNQNNQYFSKAKPGGYVTYETLRNMSRLHDVSRACINIRKQQMTQLQWDIVPVDKGDDSEEVDDIKNFLRGIGGPGVRFSKFLDQLIEDLLVIDGIALYRNLTMNGSLLHLIPIDPATIKLRVNEAGMTPQPPEIAYEQWIRGSKVADLTIDQMIYSCLNPRTDSPYGFSVMEAVAMTVEASLKAGMYATGYFTDGSVPDGFYELPAEWQLDQIKEFQSYFDTLVGGDPRQQHKVKFMPATQGGKGYVPTKTFDFGSLEPFLMWLMKVTAAMFGVMPQELGFTERVNKSSSQEQTEIAKRNSIKAMAFELEELINNCILWRQPLALTVDGKVQKIIPPNPRVKFQFMDLDPKDELIDATITEKMISIGAIGADDWRKDHGLDPIGLEPYISTASGPIWVSDFIAAKGNTLTPTNPEQTNTETKPNEPAPGEKPEEKPNVPPTNPKEELKRWEKKALKDIKNGVSFRKFNSDVLDSFILNNLPIDLNKCGTKDAVKDIFTKWGDILDGINPDIEKPLKKKGKLSVTKEMLKSKHKQRFQDKVNKALNSFYKSLKDSTIKKAVEALNKADASDLAKVKQILADEFGSFEDFLSYADTGDYLESAYNLAGDTVLAKFGLDGTFNLQNPGILSKLSDRANFIINSVDETTKEELAQLITSGVADGDSWTDIAKDIRDNYPDISDYRSELIARTETSNAANQAELDFYKNNGIETKMWTVSSAHTDEDECDENEAAGAIPVNDEFPSGDDAPPNHPNCFCDLTTELPDEFSAEWLGE